MKSEQFSPAWELTPGQLRGHHLSMWYGDFGNQRKAFNRMFGIETLV